jgi:hypothetical protein
MHSDTGLVVVIVAGLIFYLRLIIIQQQRIRRTTPQPQTSDKKRKKSQKQASAPRYSILSQDKRDWVIAGAGIMLIVIGILLNGKLIPFSLAQSYWWIPLAIGIIAFSWGFK